MDPVVFRGLGLKGDRGAPLLLQRTDDDFVGALFNQLRGKSPLDAIAPSIVTDPDRDGVLKLYQPVHRTFHLAVLELSCKVPGLPRLDPTKIDSAGLVVRRRSRVVDVRKGIRKSYGPHQQGWLAAGSTLKGWVTFASEEQSMLDPDPDRRPVPSVGSAAVDSRLLELLGKDNAVAERASTLFVAPPDVCTACGKTLLFGVIPTSSLERSELPKPPGQKLFSEEEIAAMLPPHLSAGVNVSFGDVAGTKLTYRAAAERESSETRQLAIARATNQKPLPAQYLKDFLGFLRQLATQFHAFEDTAQARQLLAVFDEVQLPFAMEPKSRPAGSYLEAAAKFLVLQPDLDGNATFELPLRWPGLPQSTAQHLRARLADLAEENFAAMAPRAARFDDPTAQYELRAFVRIKSDHADCPPELVWTDPSPPFTIAPWYEAGVVAPIEIQLPDITREGVKALRPNVALKLPRRLFNFLNDNDPKDLLEGKGHPGIDIGVDWICGFNISIIFLCAFIVLFIFLILLNIVFWWLPFIKICFPIPSVKTEDA